MLKRALDLLAAVAGLLLLAPAFLLIALAIKLDSPGPVFFRQERVGLRGRPFRIFKFRTMTVGPATGGIEVTVAGDARITRVGAALRRTKLDELAQLIDVLRGTMSLVGPRPEVPRYVSHYPPEWRERLLSVRPGITDFASVRYHDENDLLARASDPEREYIEVILPTKLRYALHYVDNPTLASDLRVLGLTLRTVFVPSLPSPWSFFNMNDSKLWPWLDQAMSALNPRNRALAMAADAVVILACWHVTYLFRLGFERWQPGRPWYDDYVSFGVVLLYLLFMALTGVPRGLWRFFGFDDFKRIAAACAMAGLLAAVLVLMAKLSGVARAVLLLHPLFCLVALSLLRMATAWCGRPPAHESGVPTASHAAPSCSVPAKRRGDWWARFNAAMAGRCWPCSTTPPPPLPARAPRPIPPQSPGSRDARGYRSACAEATSGSPNSPKSARPRRPRAARSPPPSSARCDSPRPARWPRLRRWYCRSGRG